jgi:hypothetical protein
MVVRAATALGIPARVAWDALKRRDTFLYITRGAVSSSVRPTQSHAFSLASDHDVSSMCADGAATTAAATWATIGSSTSAAWRSSLEIMPRETSSPKRSEANCWIGRLASRYEPASTARIARRRGPNGPVGTPVGSSARVAVPQHEQVRWWRRYSSTSGRTGGISAT